MATIEQIQQDIRLALKNNSAQQLRFVARLADEKLEELKNVIEQRNAAVNEIKEILDTVERIRIYAEKLPVDIDDAFGELCLRHCGNAGIRCFREGDTPEGCANWKWRGSRQCPECQSLLSCEQPKQEHYARTKTFCPEFTPEQYYPKKDNKEGDNQ